MEFDKNINLQSLFITLLAADENCRMLLESFSDVLEHERKEIEKLSKEINLNIMEFAWSFKEKIRNLVESLYKNKYNSDWSQNPTLEEVYKNILNHDLKS